MSVNETYLTVFGRVGSEPDLRERGQSPHLSFRLASTPRQFDKNLGYFVDKTTSWFQVECWRQLAQNTFDSVQLGQPVIVAGKLRTHEWKDDNGEPRSRLVLEAIAIGHDLTRGTTTYTKSAPRAEHAVPEVTAAPFPADEFPVTTLPLAAEAA
ncbi:single-stranded DNA-binding protein [Kribbella sp. NPDC003557]|uniref:single-stranded DNA-binding protein n=1 Tax=Kribbella sp. NPDC003557 TaxID=3154449 RepID=UPI00339E456A